MTDAAPDDWDGFVETTQALTAALSKSKAANVTRADLRESAKGVVQGYFTQTRPHLRDLGCSAQDVDDLDRLLQSLLALAQGRSRRRKYITTLAEIQKAQVKLGTERLVLLGEKDYGGEPSGVITFTDIEKDIMKMLLKIVPTAALSYEQAVRDLHDPYRISYRGSANELREALREVLDHLAPNDAVMRSEGFKLDEKLGRPTQRQKVGYILRARGVRDTARGAPQDSISLVDELTGSLARTTYERSNLSTHTTTARREVKKIKMYVDSILAELLEIHD